MIAKAFNTAEPCCADVGVLNLEPDTAVSILLKSDRLGLLNCKAASEHYIIAHKKDITDLHVLPVELVVELLRR